MKRIILLVSALFLLITPVFAENISAKSAILYDATFHRVIFERNAYEKLGIASTTKIMTGLIACEKLSLDEKVKIKPEWCGIEGSSMYLSPGETLKIDDLVYGLMLMSGNDAAKAIESLYDGDFIALMNEKAEELELKDTHFTNASGLPDENHYSTAFDLAILTEEALKNPDFLRHCSEKQKNIAGRFMVNHNKLLFTVHGAIGVKTGYTESSGRCLVSAVNRNGRTFIAVTLNDPDDWNDHKKLIKLAFTGLEQRNLVKSGIVGYANASGRGKTPVCINTDIVLSLSDEEAERVELSLIGDRIVYGEIRSGERFGRLAVILDGTEIASEDVFFTENLADLPVKKSFWERLFKG